ncbi:MAG: OmpH family outer membrane protein [Candidatus Aminicenantes bacterium]
MLKRWPGKLLLLFGVLVVAAGAGYAQNIGVVNSQEILERSQEGEKVMAQLQEEEKRNQAELSRRDEEIAQLQKKLNTQRLTLTPEALRSLQSDLENKRTERQRFAEDINRQMNELAARLFQKIQNEVLPIIETIGKEKNLDIIFDLSGSGAIYVSPTVDLTAEVIERYDASTTSG